MAAKKNKAFTRKVNTITINVAGEDYEGLQIVMRKMKISDYAKLLPIINMDDKSEDLAVIQEVLETLGNTVADFAVSWNMVDEDGQAVPVREIATEELALVQAVFQGWVQAQVGVEADLGKDLNSGETSPMPLLQMEAL